MEELTYINGEKSAGVTLSFHHVLTRLMFEIGYTLFYEIS